MAEYVLDIFAESLNDEIIEMMVDGETVHHMWPTVLDSMPFWMDIVRPNLVAMFASSDPMAKYTIVVYSPVQDVFEAYFFETPHAYNEVRVKNYVLDADNEGGRIWLFQYDDDYNCYLNHNDYTDILEAFYVVLSEEHDLGDGNPFKMYTRALPGA